MVIFDRLEYRLFYVLYAVYWIIVIMHFKRIYHWGLQVLPPLSLMLILGSHGPGMWFLLTFPSVFFLISLISFIGKIVNFQKNKIFLVRPALTIVVVAALYLVASFSYSIALKEAKIIFSGFSMNCASKDTCNLDLVGWELLPDDRYMVKVGSLVT